MAQKNLIAPVDSGKYLVGNIWYVTIITLYIMTICTALY